MDKYIKVPDATFLILKESLEKNEINHSQLIKTVRIKKKTPNAFLLFRCEYAGKIKKQYPNETNQEISKKCGQLWKSLSQELKNSYILQAEEIKHSSPYVRKKGKKHNEIDEITKKIENLELTDKIDSGENILHLIKLLGLN
jgi:hypothetical protein